MNFAYDRYKPVRWTLSKDWDTEMAFDRAIQRLNKTSSPGIPFCKEQTSIGKWLQWDGIRCNSDQRERLWHYVQQVMNGEYKHQYRVFIKNEMHNKQKVREGRWRLIMASSLPVQVVWQMLFGELNDKLNDKVYETPSFHGFIMCGGGWKMLRHYLKSNRLTKCIDKRAWDINSPGWVYRAILALRIMLCKNPSNKWVKIALQLYRDAYEEAELVFPEGQIYKQNEPGIMKSGLVNTISDNSIAQDLLHIGACLRACLPITPLIATGDDTAQQLVTDDYLEHLEQLGCVVKEVVEGYQFMGFDHENFTPMYPAKHLAALMVQKPEHVEETLDAYMHVYVHHPYYEKYRRVSQKLGFSIQPKERHEFWLDNPLSLKG